MEACARPALGNMAGKRETKQQYGVIETNPILGRSGDRVRTRKFVMLLTQGVGKAAKK